MSFDPAKLERRKLVKLLTQPDTPSEVLNQIYRFDPSLLREIAMHSNTSPQTLTLAVQSVRDVFEFLAVMNHPNTPDDALNALVDAADSSNLFALAHLQNARALLAASRTHDVTALFALLSNPECPAEALEHLFERHDWDVRRRIVWHPNCTPELRDRIQREAKIQNVRLYKQPVLLELLKFSKPVKGVWDSTFTESQVEMGAPAEILRSLRSSINGFVALEGEPGIAICGGTVETSAGKLEFRANGDPVRFITCIVHPALSSDSDNQRDLETNVRALCAERGWQLLRPTKGVFYETLND